MPLSEQIKQSALNTLSIERDAIEKLKASINQDFVDSVDIIYRSKGRVVVTGIGKSAHIASKIVATLNSTGTSSVFMHAADAIHGDLGIIRKEDIVIALSKSGETPEIKVLVPLIKSAGNPLIAIVGNKKSYLAKQATKVLDVSIEKEACQNNLAPTTSTTAQLVMGDALAVALIEVRGFSSRDFAKFHPGGTLGKRLYMRVKDLSNNEIPRVQTTESMKKIIVEISSKRLGATAVLDNEKLVGIITDGDLRRMLEKHPDYLQLKAVDVMTPNPKTIQQTSLVVDALTLMKENDITQLPVLKKEKYVGVIHLHDILKEGIL